MKITDKLNGLSKKQSAILLFAGLFVASGAASITLDFFAQTEGDGTITEAVSSDIQDQYTFSDVAGGETVSANFTLTNNAEVPTPVKFQTTVENTSDSLDSVTNVTHLLQEDVKISTFSTADFSVTPQTRNGDFGFWIDGVGNSDSTEAQYGSVGFEGNFGDVEFSYDNSSYPSGSPFNFTSGSSTSVSSDVENVTGDNELTEEMDWVSFRVDLNDPIGEEDYDSIRISEFTRNGESTTIEEIGNGQLTLLSDSDNHPKTNFTKLENQNRDIRKALDGETLKADVTGVTLSFGDEGEKTISQFVDNIQINGDTVLNPVSEGEEIYLRDDYNSYVFTEFDSDVASADEVTVDTRVIPSGGN